ncbi:Ig-like domain-containing protein [Candidatus Saccharibacteria bacterium]|nr:Ig-like domain-containing protein [Candidatus Saccharibacteria bacterium]
MSGRTKTRVRGIFGVLMAIVFVLVGGQMAFAQYPVGNIPEYYDWTADAAWKVKKFTNKSNKSSIKLLAQFKSNDESFGEGTSAIPLKKDQGGDYYYGQVGTVTEDKYVFLVGRADSSQESYLYFANRTDGKIVKSIAGNFGHPNSIYYKWGAGQVKVGDGGDCYSTSNFKKVNCIVGAPGGSALDRRLTVQGRASQDSWTAVAGWDAADDYWGGQVSYYARNSNGVALYNSGNMAFEKSLYIGTTASAGGLSLKGELEDVSFDDDLNLYLFYNLASFNNGAAFFKIPYNDWHSDPSPDEANDDDGGAGKALDKKDYDASIKTTADVENSGSSTSPLDEVIPLESVEEGACTSILPGNWCSNKDATGISNVVNFILTILTGGAVVAGTIGLIVCGVMWMSARDDEVAVVKAKRRMANIVIGVVAWVLVYALANLVIPRTSSDLEQGNINITTGGDGSDDGGAVSPDEDINDPNDTPVDDGNGGGDNGGGNNGGKDNGGNSNGNASNNSNPVQSVTISNDKKEMVLDKTGGEKILTVSAKIVPSNATNKGLTWSSSDNSIASVDKGKITFKNKAGTVTITAENRATGKKDTTTITVRNHKLIMVGNSKTHRNPEPSVRNQLDNIFKNRGLPISITAVSPGGTTLSYKVGNECTYAGKKCKNTIAQVYDTGIIQEQTSTIKDLNAFKAGAKAVKDVLVSKNSKIKLYVRQAWATYDHLNTNDDQSVMNSNAASVASYIGATLIKDGRAFYKNKSIDLYNKTSSGVDKNHASDRGAYLAALCIYKKVIGGDATKITYWPGGMKKSDAQSYQRYVNSDCR